MVTTLERTNNNHVSQTGTKRRRVSHLKDVRLGDLVPAPTAQRAYSPSWAAHLASIFNLEGMGFLVVSHRAGMNYIIDGQHRVGALKLLDFSDDDLFQCEVYEDLTEDEENELFLERNDSKAVSPLDKFLKAVNAGRPRECAIDRVVRVNGFAVGRRRREGGTISAAGSLGRVFDRHGEVGLGMVVRIIRDAYGDAGFQQDVIEGISLCLHRYNGQIDEHVMADRLGKANGGLNGLVTPAQKDKVTLGQSKAQCVAAQAAKLYNNTQTGKKLAPWWN